MEIDCRKGKKEGGELSLEQEEEILYWGQGNYLHRIPHVVLCTSDLWGGSDTSSLYASYYSPRRRMEAIKNQVYDYYTDKEMDSIDTQTFGGVGSLVNVDIELDREN